MVLTDELVINDGMNGGTADGYSDGCSETGCLIMLMVLARCWLMLVHQQKPLRAKNQQ